MLSAERKCVESSFCENYLQTSVHGFLQQALGNARHRKQSGSKNLDMHIRNRQHIKLLLDLITKIYDEYVGAKF